MPLLAKPTITPVTRTVNGKPLTQYLIYAGTEKLPTGRVRGVRFYRQTEAKAKALAAELTAKVKTLGSLALKLTAEQTVDAANALKSLSEAGCGKTLYEVTAEWLESRGGASTCDCSVGDAIAAYLKTVDMAKDHGQAVRRATEKWVSEYGAWESMSRLTRTRLESLLTRTCNPKSFNHYRQYILTFLKWCANKGLYPNAMYEDCAKIETKRVPYKPKNVMDVADVEKVLRWCERQPDAEQLVPYYAVAFFAGIRDAEIRRLRWGDIRFRDGIIRVESPKGAVGVEPRIVTLADNLKAWLLKYQLDDGEQVAVDGYQFAVRKAKMLSDTGVQWRRDTTRHTALTAHLAKHRNLAMTADFAGHGANVDTTKRFYLGLMDKADADAYWALMPNEGA